MITKQRVKNEQIKGEYTCSLCFVNSKEFLGNGNNINKNKDLLENPPVTMIITWLITRLIVTNIASLTKLVPTCHAVL